MVALGACPPGPLRPHAEGIRYLTVLFPGHWPFIAGNDMICRSEQWARLQERFSRDPPAGYSPKSQWGMIIGASAHGSSDALQASWWSRALLLPAQTTGSMGQAISVGSVIEGGLPLPGVAAAAGSAGRREDRPKERSRSRRRSRAERRRPEKKTEAPSANNRGVCLDWNFRKGRCAGDGPCPAGRDHVCIICTNGATHRCIEKHGWAVDPRKSKGDAKGDAKGSGKGKADNKGGR